MDYYIYKLAFTTPYRFGSTTSGAGLEQADEICHADTLFAALANEVISFYGQEVFDKFKNACIKGELLLSDTFPYSKNSLFLPKPLLSVSHRAEKTVSEIKKRMENTKLLKKRKYIPIRNFNEYINSIHTGKKIANENIGHNDAFTQKELIEHVNCRGDESLPYFVEQVNFAKDCGLYFIIACQDSDLYQMVSEFIKALSYSGIGSKRSSGYGKFTYKLIPLEKNTDDKDISILYKMLTTKIGDKYMALSTVIPKEDEVSVIKKGFYNLLPRSGFVTDVAYSSTPLKRNRYFSIAQGSCFPKPIIGNIIDVNNNGKHPVYRYGKGLYVRLSL